MHDPLVLVQTIGAAVAVVARRVPPSGIAALVLGVADHAVKRRVGDRPALPAHNAAAVQIVCNRPQAQPAGDIPLEHLAHDGGLRLDDFQTAVHLVIAEQVVLTEQHTVLLRPLEAEARTFGQLAHLVLRDRGHDGQPQFGVFVKGIDVIVLKKYAHSMAEQCAGIADAVQRIASKTADLLGDDQVKPAVFRVLNHFEELLALGD